VTESSHVPRWRTVKTQSELDKVTADGDWAEITESGRYRAFGSATVRAFDSATVEAFDSATVEAFGSATVRAFGSATVRASKYVAVHRKSGQATIAGGVVIEPPDLTTPAGWLDYYDIEPDENSVVILYKAVDADTWKSDHGTAYPPGSTPEALDWRADAECGHGLHFSPRPHMTRVYTGQRNYVACPVLAATLVPIGDRWSSDTAKSARVVKPGCSPCDIGGNVRTVEAAE